MMTKATLAVLIAGASLWAQTAPQYPNYPSETPAKFQPSTSGFDYMRREAMIPMRDGVKLQTVILIPKGAKNAPMLMTRTPYNANKQTSAAESPYLAAACKAMTTRWT